MLKTILNNTLIFLSILLITLSCTKDVDFDQAEAIAPTPTLESNLVFFNFNNENLLDEDTQQEFLMLADTTRLEVISDNFFVDNLVRTDITLEFTNSFQRPFELDILFLNDANELKYSIESTIESGTIANPTVMTSTTVIDIDEIDTFKEATKLVVKTVLPPTATPITPTSEGNIKFRSKATFYLDL
jgi:hypothetical protein